MAPPEAIDEAIAACLAEPTRATFAAVAALGPSGLRRLHDIYYRGAPWAAPDLGGAGREIVDVWARMLLDLAVANPAAYLEQLATHGLKLTTLEVVILSAIDDPQATTLLVRCCHERDWVIRAHAVEGLVRRDEPAALEAVARAAKTDGSLVVRVAAAKGVARRDPERGRAIYRGLLDHPHLTPLIKQEIERELGHKPGHKLGD